jgi:tellurite resistance protein TerC
MMDRQPLDVPLWAWGLFGALVVVSLVVDLATHRGDREFSRREAVGWSVAWIALALAFGVWVAFQFGHVAAGDYITAYLIEKSLSVDNLFVFLVVFQRLEIAPAQQHRVLFWGILGALVFRVLFIAAGAAVLERWHEAVYVLGAFLIYTGYKTARSHGEDKTEGEDRVLDFLRRHLRIGKRQDEHRFFTVENGRRVATPLLLALLAIEVSDILFAVDSVPAVFAITADPFIVYSSNVFAILGLRALYLVLADLLKDLKYLHWGLAAILALAGVKMLTGKLFKIPHWASLLAIVTILVASIVPSLLARRRRDVAIS